MSKVRENRHSSEEQSSSSGTSSSPSSDDEEIDARDLKPIKEYLLDRRELARQLFKSVKPEKIRMMLPQALKKMNLGELEEWCASELSGMSKSRILCLLNGKTMFDSSDTSESDNSGPSLEIISDTEEWFTDGDDIVPKIEGEQSSKIKKAKVKAKAKNQPNKKCNNKSSHKKGLTNKTKDIEIKTENKKTTTKDKKEGDSLLDLFELELRARAIRALIRKEEDVIPVSNVFKSTASKNSVNEGVVTNSTQDELKEKENCRRHVEMIISAQQGSIVVDEDVVLVVQPTPTIELLTSDSEEEGCSGTRINKKFQNERDIETEKQIDQSESGNVAAINKKNSTENLETSKTRETTSQETTEIHRGLDAHKHEIVKRLHSNNIDSSIHSPSKTKPEGKRRKVKKKSHVNEKLKTTNSKSSPIRSRDSTQNIKNVQSNHNLSLDSVSQSIESVKSVANEHKSVDSQMVNDSSLEEQDGLQKQNKTSKVVLDEEKSTDLDEIIDLDAYCDDMDDIESCENDKDKNKHVVEKKQSKSQPEINFGQKANSSETWASRYYQTDDVQTVIKESKIQSEIRKRLRERQRLSKSNKSPNQSSPSSSPVTENTDKPEQAPTGSVDEYLALKRTGPVSLNSNSSNNGIHVTQDNDKSLDSHTKESASVMDDKTVITNSTKSDVNTDINSANGVNVDSSLVSKKVDSRQIVSVTNESNPR